MNTTTKVPTTAINLMVDIETTGTVPGSCILAIGAIAFNETYTGIHCFYEKIDLYSCMELGMTSSGATTDWWMKQDSKIREEAFSGTKDIKLVLTEFAEFIRQLPYPPLIWGNGANFDNVLLDAAYRMADIPKPWIFRDDRCYRTLKELFPQVPYTKPVQAHNALEDARAQAVHASQILALIEEAVGHATTN